MIQPFEAKPKRIESTTELKMPDDFWFSGPAIKFTGIGRRPRGREWLRCLWNCDVFCHRVPFLKSVALVSFLIAFLT